MRKIGTKINNKTLSQWDIFGSKRDRSPAS